MSTVPRAGLVLGVDGGNSKTIALAARLDGTVVGAARGGNTDIYGATSAEHALAELERTVQAALAAAGAAISDLQVASYSLAGADWPEDIALIEQALAIRALGQRCLVVNDALGALRAGSRSGTGVSVVCGTGGAVGARSPDGTAWHASWWQEPQGSKHLAEKVLRAVYRAELGIDPPTGLTARVLEVFALDSVEAVLHTRTRRVGRGVDRHADLTRALLAEAACADSTALQLINEHGRALGDLAVAAARRVGIASKPFPLVLAGGVFRHQGRVLARAVIERARASCPTANPVTSPLEPAAGAVLLSFDALGVEVNDGMEERLRASMPAPALFAT